MRKYKLMIVEDNEELREGINILLSGDEYATVLSGSGEECLEKFDEGIDLVILDIMLPGISGIKVCEEIRKKSNVPILFLTAKAAESDKLLGFMAGGDDYLVKPFSYSELMARVKAQLRRYYEYKGKTQAEVQDDGEYIAIGDVRLNKKYNEVFVRDERIEFSDIDYNILKLFMSSPDRIFSAKNIYESVWNEPYFYVCNNTIMVHIRKMRTKIEKDSQNPEYIHTVWGKGYKFNSGK